MPSDLKLNQIENIIIIKVAAIGDNIMAFPVATEIKKINSNIRIHWLCGQAATPLALIQNDIDNVFSINEKKLLTGSFLEKIIQILKIWTFIFSIKNKEIFILHTDRRYKILWPFNFNIKLFKPFIGRHHSRQYIEHCLNIRDFQFPIKYNLNGKIFVNNPRSNYILIAPGGAKNILSDDFLRRWPIENYVELVDLLIKDGLKPLLIGGNDDKWTIQHFPKQTESRIGQTGLIELTQLISSARLLVSHDSGPIHLASMVNTPVISLFGPTQFLDKEPLTNINNRALWLGHKLKCAPCYDNKNYNELCKDPICMREITPQIVFEEIKKILEKELNA